MSLRSPRRTLIVSAFALANLISACPRDLSHEADAGASDAVDGGSRSGPYKGDAGPSSTTKCLVSSEAVQANQIDKVDLLLVVDNSNSMAGEQQSLQREFPNIFRTLTTGFRFDGDQDPFPPVKDLHVGVVSSDMGIPGVELPPSCHANGGDDGKLQHTPHGDGCDAQYPLWLNYVGDAKLGPITDPSKFANDVSCIAMLGTGGCGFEQQLEAPFKALMPKLLTDAAGNVVLNPYRFIAADEPRTWGRGDMPVAQGGNMGFLRNAMTQGPSVIAIIVVTDEEDCSVRSTDHLKPNNQLPEDSPYRMEDINLRCFNHKEFLYDVQQRYLAGFRALRPSHENLVVFAAIAGVPADLVDHSVLANLNYEDAAQREQFYANILNDARMTQQVDPTSMPGTGQGNLRPSCVRTVPGENAPATAFPPRRIVELARLFGANGIVQSICQDDFGPAMSVISNVIAKQLGESCLEHPLQRQSNGLAACDVIWELPAQPPPGAAAPTTCDQLPFLGPVGTGHATSNTAGGQNCKVQQLAVTNTATKLAPNGEGWFYDDFTGDLLKACKTDRQQRIAFSASAKPPQGVTVKLECQSRVSGHTSAANQDAAASPAIGSACGHGAAVSDDAACVVTVGGGTTDASLFCHPQLSMCVKRCTATTDCPSGWTCDQSPETLLATAGRGAFCVDPKCSR